MSERIEDMGDTTDVVVITFTDPDNLPAYCRRHGLELRVLVDPERRAYDAFGLGRGSVRRVWGLRAAKHYLDILRSGGLGRLARPTEDTLQLGGDFIVGPDGVLIYGFWSEGPDDRPSVDELIAALDNAPDR